MIKKYLIIALIGLTCLIVVGCSQGGTGDKQDFRGAGDYDQYIYSAEFTIL